MSAFPMIFCVVPTCRPDRMAEFKAAWEHLFWMHSVKLVEVRDGSDPQVRVGDTNPMLWSEVAEPKVRELLCNHTDAVRNYGFLVVAERSSPGDLVLTMDDDVLPPPGHDPIQAHLDVMGKRVPLSWMNTAPSPPWPYLRGVPYSVRREGRVMLSHGVWSNVPDFDASTQMQLGEDAPQDMPYHTGPVPKGVLFPLCGMNVMVSRDALPYFYFAPGGPNGHDIHRFADIWMGVALKAEFDRRGWACYTGASKVVHTRLSDVYKNLAREAEGMRLNEQYWNVLVPGPKAHPYFAEYQDKRRRYAEHVQRILAEGRP